MMRAAKKQVKEYERQLKADPENLVLRLKLAAALREVGRTPEAVDMYRSVAIAYHQQGRLAQAIAVCRSVLEIEPAHREIQALLASLDAMRLAREVAPAPAEGAPDAPLAAAPSGPVMARPQFFAPQAVTVAAPSPSSSSVSTPLPPNISLLDSTTPPPVDLPTLPPPPRLRAPSPGGAELTPQNRSDPFRAVTPGNTPRLPLSPPIDHELPGGPAVTVPGLPRPKLPQARLTTPPPLPPREDEEDDGLTIPAYSPRLAQPPVAPAPPAAADPHEAETRVADSLVEVAAALPHAAGRIVAPHPLDDAPTHPGEHVPTDPGHGGEGAISADPATPPPALPPDLSPFARRDRLLDLGPWPDTEPTSHSANDPGVPRSEPTRANRPGGMRSESDSRDTDPRAPERHDTTPFDRVAEEGDHELTLAKAFDRPFAAAVEDLAPDGSTIEPPLTIFRRLPPEALRELHRRMVIRRVSAGTVIVREGEPGEACYVVQSGCVRVLKRDPARPASDQIEVARLATGSLFGEFALLADRRRHATVQAIEPTELYEIPRRLLRELAASYPDVGPALERLYRERLLSTLIATAPFFRPLPEEERVRLMARFQPCRVEAGDTVVREGDRAGGLYLVVLGTVEITKKVDGQRAVLLAALGEGSYFGEMSLLRGTAASASVTAAGPVELAMLPPREFYAVLSEYPILWEELRREAQRRELANQNILAGDTHVV